MLTISIAELLTILAVWGAVCGFLGAIAEYVGHSMHHGRTKGHSLRDRKPLLRRHIP